MQQRFEVMQMQCMGDASIGSKAVLSSPHKKQQQ